MVYKMTGVIFSDLGAASTFMTLDWVQQALQQRLGYHAFPGTLNLRPLSDADGKTWLMVQKQLQGIELPATREGFCSAKLYPVDITHPGLTGSAPVRGAALVPAVAVYPKDKIEVVAPLRLKEKLGVTDGDQLTLEFVP